MFEQKQPLWSRSVAAALAVALGISAVGCRGDKEIGAMIAEARKYRDQGESRAAVIQLKIVIQQDGANSAARILLGELYVEDGDAVSAEKELRRAMALGGDAGQIAPLLGKAMLMQGQYDRLLGEIQPAAEPARRPLILALRGSALLGLGKPDAAREAFADALKLNPASPDALVGMARLAIGAQDTAQAHAYLDQALKASPSSIDALRLRGDLHRASGKPAEAMSAYRGILALRPANMQALVDVSNLHIDSGNLRQARETIAQARTAAPGAIAVFHSQAMLDYREGKHKAALESVQKILREIPDHLPSVLLAGAIQSALGSTQQAEQYLQKFLESYPRHLYASKLMSALHLRRNAPDEALVLLRPLILAHPDDVELLALAGEAKLRGRHFTQAAEFFEKAAALRPAAPGLRTGVALSRLGNGDNGRAVAELERAASLDNAGDRAGMLLAMSYLRAKAPDKAMATVQRMENQANNPLVQNLKGGIWLAKHDLGAARASFEAALKLDPSYLPALDNLAQLDTLEGRPADARKRYRNALAKAPGDAALMEALGRLAAAEGKRAEAMTWLERASADNPANLRVALRLVDFYARASERQKALVLAQKLVATHPANPDALAMLAQVSYMNEDFAAAAEGYARLVAMAPRNAGLHARYATVQMKLKDEAGALASLNKALALDPDLADAQVNLLNVHIGQKKFAEALSLARSVQNRRPESARGHKLEGDVLSTQNKHPEALKAYERAFDLQQNGALLIQLHGALIKNGKAADAQARMNEWFRNRPDDIPTRLYYASSMVVARDYEAAAGHLHAVLKSDPDNVIALNDLAWAYQRMNRKEALHHAERAHKLAPNSPAIMDTLGWIHLETGNLGRALPLLQKASALAPDAAEIRYHYGMVLAKSGDKASARRELERALSAKDFTRRDEARALLATL
ncbi:PEP-CTERM system TPR-repeat protein PrsT [Massilia sp. RP-1-19]|uniref:PEP-CTERM system TPR-repeat protein PrsT n=1 Tax=Massilia polaris TaxID=2728846 RepID=A0A848HJ85_9BURK|nr:XrtA/PEP-CTERM system TPR-repeat protein PrsT [Massilia polaris]NML60199.1 PEP-CTERM system TPR-repeat protein PrsT [Massilia polaris]